LSKTLIERVMQAVLTEQIGYTKSKPGGNRGNGKSSKTPKTDHGSMEIAIPQERDRDFEPRITGKHQREWRRFDDKILSVYNHGMSTRRIRATIKDIYNVDIFSEPASRVTDKVKGIVQEWRNRPLETFYPRCFSLKP
jgi:transposase-like protein